MAAKPSLPLLVSAIRGPAQLEGLKIIPGTLHWTPQGPRILRAEAFVITAIHLAVP